MKQTPQQFRDLAESAELYDQSEAVGNKFNLHIDQIGELDAEIRDVLNGVSESTDFSKHIMQRLEIDRSLADQIVQEVNKAIFDTLRQKMQDHTAQEQKQSTISSLEQAGGFNIERKEEAKNAEIKPLDRNQLLQSLENPPRHSHHTANPPANLPSGDTAVIPQTKPSVVESPHTEPIVDYLLQNPLVQGEHKTVVQPPKSQQEPTQKAPRGPDPYREIV